MKLIEEEWRYFDETLDMPYPWYTRPALEIIEQWDLKGKLIFEYGAGDSTFWYRKKGAETYGVESDKKWADYVGYTVMPLDKQDYIESSTYSKQKYDIIIIDGDYRDECTQYALQGLREGGFLIIDNYKQPSVQADWPLTERLIEGKTIALHKEPGHEDWVTAIIIK